VIVYYGRRQRILAAYLRGGRSIVRLSFADVRLAGRLRDILRVGAIAALITIQTNLTIAIATAGFVGPLRAAAIAGYGTGFALSTCWSSRVSGLGAARRMVGTNIGAGSERALRAAWIGAGVAAALNGDHRPWCRRPPRTGGSRCSTRTPAMLDAGSRYLRLSVRSNGPSESALALYFASLGAGGFRWPLIAN